MELFAAVTIIPILKNSLKVKVTLCLFSAVSKIITLLAAPKIVKVPAIVLPAASAIQGIVSIAENP